MLFYKVVALGSSGPQTLREILHKFSEEENGKDG